MVDLTGPAAIPDSGIVDEAWITRRLALARELTEPALRAAVGTLHPDSALVASYHLGWTDPEGNHVAAGGGKAIRPCLAILSAQADGGSSQLGIPGAVAVELMHNFSLIHDDIMDNDTVRRDRPAAWTVFGMGPAILAGDALFAQSLAVLSALRTPAGAAAGRRLAWAGERLSHGQAADLAFERRPWTGPGSVGVEEYLAMVCDKTGALIATAAAIGAILASASAPVIARLSQAGLHLGIAFQIADDLLGLRDDQPAPHRPPHGDLRQRKKTLPVISALQAQTQDSRRLADFLREGLVDAASLRFASGLVEAAGGRKQAERAANHHLALATALIRELPEAGDTRAGLLDLAAFLVDRVR